MDLASTSTTRTKRERKPRHFSGESVKSESAEYSEGGVDSDGKIQGSSSKKREGRKKRERNISETSSCFKLAFASSVQSVDETGHKSAFSRYNPRTILTNLQRGNIQTETVILNTECLSFHQKAGKGELLANDIEMEPDINKQDSEGLTPLMWACAYGQVPTASLLLRYGALHTITTSDGETALHLAAAGGHTDIIRLLVKAGASVNGTDDNGNTPLMYAAYGNHAHAVNELLNNSADITAENLNDDTAFSIAVKRSSNQAQMVMEGYLFMLLQPA